MVQNNEPLVKQTSDSSMITRKAKDVSDYGASSLASGSVEFKNERYATDREGNEESTAPPNQLVVIWMSIVAHWRIFTTWLYNSTVEFLGGFIADVMSHQRVQDTLVEVIVAAMNAFMKQDDIGTKIDDTARRVIYDPQKARNASRAIGKEVVPMVTGFVGGVASSLTPSMIKSKKSKSKNKLSKSSSNHTVSTIDMCSGISGSESSGLKFDSISEEREKDKSQDFFFSRIKKSS